VEAMWLMLQQKTADDFVIATNEMHSVREFCEYACKEAGFDIAWQGKGVKEKGLDKKTGKIIFEIDPKYFRPTEVELLIGDYSKAKKIMGWQPKTKFKDLVRLMMKYDLEHPDSAY
ncbi:MAG TPA: GDP-mannose 4,6-dehydratase, partial [Spirochaetia bacterium]|nr:GDP-mannose 4,6-dehydratase [Spirochaetia bacterium]